MMNRLFMRCCLCILNTPNLQAQSGSDGEVSVVTGSPKSGSKPFSARCCSDNGEDIYKGIHSWMLSRQLLATHPRSRGGVAVARDARAQVGCSV